ncbi:glycosyltransferase family 2 protein [Tropicibacter sp. Alg240-R139]|uniref:glycosyltransferase n=1 Tax=Tropicibacter sp. Alg240-R139 TaxID=2305991 RepID=UPI0013DFBCFF|nr:glycosyltransferase [Tropicibacter sp. Alg240-R139]
MSCTTILIPAHNEAAVIGRTLWFLSRGLPQNAFEVIVIANGCTDATAARTRAAVPQATVIETERAGKCHALNLGYAASAKGGPVIFLDADLDVTSDSIKALIAPLTTGTAQAACGQMDVVTTHASPLVKAFYRGWRTNPYFTRGKFGGLFALSAATAARLLPLPEITADDEFIRRSVPVPDIALVNGCNFSARAPANLSDLIKVRRRSIRGARQLGKMGLFRPDPSSLPRMIHQALTKPSEFIPVLVFLTIMIWVRVALAFEGENAKARWERDLSSRAVG